MGCKRLSDDEEKHLVEEYINGECVTILQQKYGFSTKKSIIDKVKKYYPNNYDEIINIAKNNRKNYKIDLSKINCKFNAYFIGLMLTDGYIIDNTKFGIDLIDEDCIRFISNITNKPYYKYIDTRDNKRNPKYRITFSDKKAIKKLSRFGITMRKSYTLPALQVQPDEEKFLPYIIRGIIDGNGCIFKTTNNTVGFYICSMSKIFIQSLKNIFETKLYMEDIKITQEKGGIWHVQSFLQTNIFKLLAIVYDRPYGMSRKYNKLREMFRDYNKNNQQEFIWNL